MNKKLPSAYIRDIVSPVKKWNPSQSGQLEPFNYIDLSSIDQVEKQIVNSSKINPKEAPSRARQLVREGDVLVSTVRPNLNGVACVPQDYDSATASTGFCVLRPKKDELHGRFLFYWVQTEKFIGEMVRLATGASYPAISDRIIKDSKIPLPPLTEQKRIAAILDKAMAIRNKKKHAIILSDEFLKSIFFELFGDPIANKKRWPTIPIGDLSRIVRGSSPRPKGDPRYYGGNIPRLMVEDVTRDGFFVTPKIDSLTEAGAKLSRPVPKGTLVIVVSGKVGVVAKLTCYACIHDGFVGFLDIDASKIYVNYLMFSLDLLRETHGSREAGAIFKNLTTTQIKEMAIPVPPLALQKKFDSFFKNFSDHKKIISQSLIEAESLIGSIAQRAFRGEL